MFHPPVRRATLSLGHLSGALPKTLPREQVSMQRAAALPGPLPHRLASIGEPGAPDMAVLQRKITIVDTKTTYSNLGNFQKDKKVYERLIRPLLEEYPDAKRVEFHLSQMFSVGGDVMFQNEQHFLEALEYDITTKSLRDEDHTLQEQYLTLYGWKRRRDKPKATSTTADTGAKGSKKGGGTTPAPKKGGGGERAPRGPDVDAPRLKIYRTMKTVDFEALKGDPKKLSGHLGDFKQAQNYLYRKSAENKVLVQFTLKAGAERTLFSEAVMAFPKDPGAEKVPNVIKSVLVKEGASGEFAVANKNEGTAPDRVGIKAERGEAGFSFGIGGGKSPTAFMNLVDAMDVVGTAKGVADAPTLDALMSSEDEQTSTQGSSSSPKGKEKKVDPDDGAGAERERRLRALLAALGELRPARIDDEPRAQRHDPQNQYVQPDDGKASASQRGKEKDTGSSASAKRYAAQGVTVRENRGGGDCLFHALHGHDLTALEMLAERERVAAVRRGKDDVDRGPSLNAHHVAAALSQTPDTRDLNIMEGRHEVPNAIYALMQAVPGMYAGEDELLQWCELTNRRVLVLDTTLALGGGALAMFSPEGRLPIAVTEHTLYDTAREWAARMGIWLFKTPAHWERIDTIDG